MLSCLQGLSGLVMTSPGPMMLKVPSMCMGFGSLKESTCIRYLSPRWRCIHSMPKWLVTWNTRLEFTVQLHYSAVWRHTLGQRYNNKLVPPPPPPPTHPTVLQLGHERSHRHQNSWGGGGEPVHILRWKPKLKHGRALSPLPKKCAGVTPHILCPNDIRICYLP